MQKYWRHAGQRQKKCEILKMKEKAWLLILTKQNMQKTCRVIRQDREIILVALVWLFRKITESQFAIKETLPSCVNAPLSCGDFIQLPKTFHHCTHPQLTAIYPACTVSRAGVKGCPGSIESLKHTAGAAVHQCLIQICQTVCSR